MHDLLTPDYIKLAKMPSGKYSFKNLANGQIATYVFHDPLTGKVYVGSTDTLYRRMIMHRSFFKRGVQGNSRLNQYKSIEELDIYVRLFNDREEAFDEEQRIVDSLVDTGLLLNVGVVDVRASNKGRPIPDEVKLKMRMAHLGVPKPEGFGEKLRQANLNHPRRAELNHNLSVTRQSGDNPNAKRVEVFGVVYPCGSDASRALGIPRSTLEKRLKSDKPEYASYKKVA